MFFIGSTCYVGFIKNMLQSGVIYKDSNKLGRRKRELIKALYNKKINDRFNSIKDGDFLSFDEINKLIKTRDSK